MTCEPGLGMPGHALPFHSKTAVSSPEGETGNRELEKFVLCPETWQGIRVVRGVCVVSQEIDVGVENLKNEEG